MSITGSLSDFSLPEMAQFLERGKKTGLLTLYALPDSPNRPPSVHYIWLSQGNLIAAADRLDQQSLVSLIDQYQWVSHRVVAKLAELCPTEQPLGSYLKNQGALQSKQLEHLFQVQILQQICVLFQSKDAQFKFEQNAPIPMEEMTGLKVPAGIIKTIWQKMGLLQTLFEAKKFQRENGSISNHPGKFCHKLGLILDIAFFHSLSFSLFDTKITLSSLSQAVEWCDRPYDLPQSKFSQGVCSVQH
jgi:hypothetical protein